LAASEVEKNTIYSLVTNRSSTSWIPGQGLKKSQIPFHDWLLLRLGGGLLRLHVVGLHANSQIGGPLLLVPQLPALFVGRVLDCREGHRRHEPRLRDRERIVRRDRIPGLRHGDRNVRAALRGGLVRPIRFYANIRRIPRGVAVKSG
jgi:hypothetical protein